MTPAEEMIERAALEICTAFGVDPDEMRAKYSDWRTWPLSQFDEAVRDAFVVEVTQYAEMAKKRRVEPLVGARVSISTLATAIKGE